MDNLIKYDLLVTDLMSTDDGSSLDIDCVQLYSLQLEDKLTDLQTDLEAALEEGLCEDGDVVVSGSTKIFSALGNQA